MTRFTLLLVAMAACSHHAPAAGPASTGTSPAPATTTAQTAQAAIDAAHAEAIVNAPDCDERDRKRDAQRKPAQLLVFIGVAPGMHAADPGAGGGYTSELVARAVGPTGSMVAQDSPNWGEAGCRGSGIRDSPRRRWRTRSTWSACGPTRSA